MTEEERAGSFHHKKVGPRAAIVAAGPIANFILAIVIFTGLFTFYGKPNTSARVDKVEANSAAAAAGFQVGDVVTAIDGDTIGSFSDMQRIVGVRAGEQLTFTIKRGDATLQLHGTPELKEVKDPFGNVHRLGVLGITRATSPGDVTTERVNPATALWLGVKETWFVIDRTLAYIGGLFTGREAADQVGGPLRIAQISGQVASIGLAALVQSCRGTIDIDWVAQSVSGAVARWRSSFVLRGGGGARSPVVGSGAGNGVPDRTGVGAHVDGVCHLQRHSASGRVMMPYLDGVADGQRLGMKMKSHCDRAFAVPVKLATSMATNGNLSVRRGADRHWNDKGALRMNVGMRVRGGLVAALMMFATPVVPRWRLCCAVARRRPDRFFD